MRWAKDIQGNQGLYYELVPDIHQELLAEADEHYNQVVLEGGDCPFCYIVPVDVGGGGVGVGGRWKSPSLDAMCYFSAYEASLSRRCSRGQRPRSTMIFWSVGRW